MGFIHYQSKVPHLKGYSGVSLIHLFIFSDKASNDIKCLMP